MNIFNIVKIDLCFSHFQHLWLKKILMWKFLILKVFTITFFAHNSYVSYVLYESCQRTCLTKSNNNRNVNIWFKYDERASNSTFESTSKLIFLFYHIEWQNWDSFMIKSFTYAFANLLNTCFSLRYFRVIMY